MGSSLSLVAIVAAISAVIVAIIKVHHDRKRELLKCAIDTAHKDFEVALKLVVEGDTPKRPLPMSTYIAYHYTFLKQLDKGVPSEDAAKAALVELEHLLKIYQETNLPPYNEIWSSTL